jgi:predicted Zn-dependent protease
LASPDDARALAQRALDGVPPGNEALARVVHERSLMMRFARSRPTQATAVDDQTIEIAVVRDGHVGRADTNRTDDDSLAVTARVAVAAAEASARSAGGGAFPGFPAPEDARPHTGWDAPTAALDPAPGGAALQAAFDVGERHGVEAHGVWTIAESRIALASTSGLDAAEATTDAFMKVTCFAPDGRSGYATGAAVKGDEIDAEAIADSAAHTATAGNGEPVKLPPGEYPVVLGDEAVAEILGWVGMLGFNGLAYAEGRSAIEGRLGRRVASPSINLSDSPRHPRTLPHSYDADGTPKAPLPLIQDGVAHRIVHDVRSAALTGGGAQSTGHATTPGGHSWGPQPTNLVLMGGGAQDVGELVSKVDRGIFVTRLWYTNPVRPKEGLITGMTRDGTFLIDNGVIERPVEDLRLTDSVLGLLERVQDLGSKPRLICDGEFYDRRFASGIVCPPVRLSSMRFTA